MARSDRVVRYYTVQHRGGATGPWQTVNERVEPTVTSYTVHGLKPFTDYQFRLQVRWLFRGLISAASPGFAGLFFMAST